MMNLWDLLGDLSLSLVSAVCPYGVYVNVLIRLRAVVLKNYEQPQGSYP